MPVSVSARFEWDLTNMEINLVKIGGSVISRESSEDRFERATVQSIARQLHPFQKGLILVHGTGFVGKPPAITYGYYKSGHAAKEDYLAMLGIKDELRVLNHRFVRTMLEEDIPVMPFGISHMFTESMDCLKPGAEQEIKDVLANGYVPVFYGDLIMCRDGSFRVFSSDVITFLLSRVFHPQHTVFLSDVDGVYRHGDHVDNPSENTLIDVLNAAVASELERSEYDKNDVSGGMSAKVAHALEIAANSGACFIGSGIKPGVVSGFLRGENVPGTRVQAG